MKSILLFMLAATSAQAATWYVDKTGSDSAAGTAGVPWLTITKAATVAVAGDTVIVGNGDYDEHVQETTSGAAGSYITYRAAVPGAASLRAFRITAPYVELDGLKFSKYSGANNAWAAAVRVETAANNAKIMNCVFTQYPGVRAHDFSFDVATNRVTSPSSNFVAAGFVPGSKVYLGASGATIGGVPLFFANHDTTWEVSAVQPTYMELTNGSAPFVADTGTGYWSFVRAGSGSGGFPCVQGVITSGVGPANVTISGCTVDGWAADAFDVKGTGWVVEDNSLTDLQSFKFLTYSGSDHIIRRNLVINSGNVLHYSPAELDTVVHPASTGWYDYVTTVTAGFTTSGGNHQNVLLESNWFQNIENQVGRVDDELPGAYDVRFNRNVFVGISAPFSGGRDAMKWTNNTFYRVSFDSGAHALTIGGRAPAQSGYELSGNLFVACGPKGATQTLTRGFYSISDNAIDPVTNGNFVTSEEVTGYAAKTNFTEVSGVNGGDPVFYHAANPLGADGEPFTSDDGLKVLANSPAAALGGGACGVRPVTSGQAVAHFRVSAPTGWFEPLDEAFDPYWVSQLPTQRGALERPWDTPVALGVAGVAVTFDASKSLSGVGGATTNAGIAQYVWNWGDGTANTTTGATTATHTFATAGDRTVTLTVTNSVGHSHSTSQTYRISGDTRDVPSEYPTVALALAAAQAGDTIRIAAGTYPESVLSQVNGSATSRITIEGIGNVTLTKVTLRHSHHTLRGLRFIPASTVFGEAIWMRRGGHFARIEDCYIDLGGKKDVGGIEWEGPSTQPFGTDAASDCVVVGTTIENGFNEACISLYGDRNLVEECILRDGVRIDFFRLSGRNNVIRKNLCQNNLNVAPGVDANNHADFLQCFGRNGFGSRDHVIEGNIVRYIQYGQLTQFEGNLLPDVGYWTIRNNLFVDVALQSSCTIPGIRYLNNTFYNCNFHLGSHALTFGSRAYNATNCAPNSPEIGALGVKTSGQLEVGRDYEVAAPVVASGNLVEGVVYRVEGGSTGFITYNGTQYGRNATFTANATTTFTASDQNMILHRNASVTHNGVTYFHDDIFTAVNSTFTVSYDPVVNGVGYNRANSCEVKNNVFLACGGANTARGWYSFDQALTGSAADYNYVAKAGFVPVVQDAAQRAIGAVGGWDSFKWWEPHGINGGDPKFVDFSVYDFRLQEHSPLIDSGDTLASVLTDRVGVARPNGTGYDIGAYEFDFEAPGTPPLENDPPAAPSSLVSQAISGSTVILTWTDNSNNETHFEVAVSLDGIGWVTSAQWPANSTVFASTGHLPETAYYFRVRSVNASGFSAWSNDTVTTTQSTPPTVRRHRRPNGSVVIPP